MSKTTTSSLWSYQRCASFFYLCSDFTTADSHFAAEVIRLLYGEGWFAIWHLHFILGWLLQSPNVDTNAVCLTTCLKMRDYLRDSWSQTRLVQIMLSMQCVWVLSVCIKTHRPIGLNDNMLYVWKFRNTELKHLGRQHKSRVVLILTHIPYLLKKSDVARQTMKGCWLVDCWYCYNVNNLMYVHLNEGGFYPTTVTSPWTIFFFFYPIRLSASSFSQYKPATGEFWFISTFTGSLCSQRRDIWKQYGSVGNGLSKKAN